MSHTLFLASLLRFAFFLCFRCECGILIRLLRATPMRVKNGNEQKFFFRHVFGLLLESHRGIFTCSGAHQTHENYQNAITE